MVVVFDQQKYLLDQQILAEQDVYSRKKFELHFVLIKTCFFTCADILLVQKFHVHMFCSKIFACLGNYLEFYQTNKKIEL